MVSRCSCANANNPHVPQARQYLDVANHSEHGGGGHTSGPRYPADLSYSGGPVVTHMVSHPIYLDSSDSCNSSCWGDPQGFLAALGKSSFIHVIDQYVGTSAPNRYSVVKGVKSKGLPHPHCLNLNPTIGLRCLT